jgi:hypothetical protein
METNNMEELRKEFEKKTGITPVYKDGREHFEYGYVEGLEQEVILLRQKLSKKQVTEEEFKKWICENRVHNMSFESIHKVFSHYILIPKED